MCGHAEMCEKNLEKWVTNVLIDTQNNAPNSEGSECRDVWGVRRGKCGGQFLRITPVIARG